MSQLPEKPKPPAGEKLKVLIVDDEPTLRLGFAYALSNKTTVVETASNGRQALQRLSNVTFDIVILDLRMPELDGTAVIYELRLQGSEIPIVLCSAAMTSNAALHAIRQGVVDFLLKPVCPADLRDVIQYVLNPGGQTLPRALQAARDRRLGDAIQILETEALPTRQATAWLNVLKRIRDADAAPDGISDDGELEEKVRLSLSILAYNATDCE